jgi:hypothetical protein
MSPLSDWSAMDFKEIVVSAVVIALIGFLLIIFFTGSVALMLSAVQTSYIPSVEVYPYSIGPYLIFCKALDAEKRVAFNCVRGNPNFLGFAVQEYHLAPNDNWVRR